MIPKRIKPISVLIVDDSSSARAMLRSLIESDSSLAVMGVAQDAYAAVRVMKEALPDVILLDLELPGLDGITLLKRIMEQRPLPVVVCSSYTEFGSRNSFAALEAGAVEVILKPVISTALSRQEAQIRVCDAIHAAAQSRNAHRLPAPIIADRHKPPGPKLTADEILPPPKAARPVPVTEPIVCIGASTGGTEALRTVLEALPADAPGILIVQHMPEGFTRTFADRMNKGSAMTVSEAVDGQTVTQGQVLIGPGDHHLLLRRVANSYRAQVVGGAYVSRHRPSVDVLFRSAATAAGANAMGIILTGMGDDGARCLVEMRSMGSPTLAQDEASCVVYGMPREAVALGGVAQTVPLAKMAAAIVAFGRTRRGVSRMTALSRLALRDGDPRAEASAAADPVIAFLDLVLSRTESTFVTVGRRLETAVDAIRAMQGLFARMQGQLSPEQGAKLLAMVSVTKAELAGIEQEFDSFLHGSAGLRQVVRTVRVEVEDMDRVVRTIINVSINARIQASRLMPPRVQVAAFLERLSDMVAEAEGSLTDVKSAMAGILNRLIAMDEATVTLQAALKQEILPALARFAAQGQAVHDGQDELLRTSTVVALRMQDIFAEVSHLVVGLQSGDATRQRLERVREIAALSADHRATAQPPATEALLIQLANRLAQTALAEARREGADAVAGIGAVLDGARDALKTATDFYFGRAGERVAQMTTDAASSGQLDARLDLVRANLGHLGAMASEVRDQVEKILMQGTRLRQISHQVRLSGLNAVLICAKLGEEGRSLRELAQWLRHLTDESDSITARLQVALDRTRAQLSLTGSDRIDQLRHSLAGFLDHAGVLQAQLAGIDGSLAGAVEICRSTDHTLGLALGGARDAMAGYDTSLQDVAAASLLMQVRLALLPPPELPVIAGSSAANLLAEVRHRYTMQSERDLHDGLIGAEATATASVPSQSSAQAPANDDLDDIFF